ncbi:hypothetical protein [Wenyingzhuangia aestuarii]|uniref:hypothetical protein n=1 Tax=Wenyingzhuangia aestuarii TaxID=1647582 RepID=UPI0014395710|nr:hypothetical protein [Wenyingzhuangia aestuarii]NJB84150.1 hypothetical protein [Wenyingzhuangia aestuarii]
MWKFIIMTLFLKSSILFSQTEIEVSEFIALKSNIISLEKKSKLNDVLKKSYSAINSFLKSKNENIREYYTEKITPRIENDIVYINLYHRNGFKRKVKLNKELEKKNKLTHNKNKPRIIGYSIMGNASGKDGVLELHIKNFEFNRFLYWK